jgi:uncharacterized repeat protein (TIGR03803 family)
VRPLVSFALGSCAASILLAGCGGSPPIGAPGVMPQASALAARTDSTNYRVVYSFSGAPDGQNPQAALIAVGRALYGTTAYGGSHDYSSLGAGTVFRVTPNGKENVLHDFGAKGDGTWPFAGLIEVGGALYGTTQQGGANSTCNHSTSGCGAVFSITPSGTEKVLHSFGSGTDGIAPAASLIAVDGTLYGTTMGGGTHERGTVFALKP